MARQEASARRGFEHWQVGALRVTAFTDPVATADTRTEEKRLEALVGKPPENVLSRMSGTVHEESGPFATGGKLSYKRSPRGIEWFLEPLPEPDKPESCLWMNSAVIAPFKELIRRWLVDCPLLQRLAFGAALYLPVEDMEEGCRELRACLHLELDLANSGDFLYRINRRRPSQCGVPDLPINRLSQWQLPLLEVRERDPGQSWPLIRRLVCQLELDINTAPEFSGLLRRESYGRLFDELVTFGEEIAENGDVR
jgi:hypothetical protein